MFLTLRRKNRTTKLNGKDLVAQVMQDAICERGISLSNGLWKVGLARKNINPK
jgi:hypothetical protein